MGEYLTSARPNGFPQWALEFQVSGSRWFGHPESGQNTLCGDLLLIHPGTPLFNGGADPASSLETYWVIFQPPVYWTPLLKWPQWLPGIMRIQAKDSECFDEVQQTLGGLIATFESGHPLAEIRAMHELNGFLLRCHDWLPHEQGVGIAPCLEKSLRLMSEKLASSLTLRELASSANLSPSRFYVVFKQTFEVGPMQYLARYRMHRACTLLLGTDRLIKQIGAEVGYPEIDRFSARFRKTMGSSPQAFRAAHKRIGG